ncbi:hypothetical protein BGZ90_001120 [Linnemannia elongata]|nr:hypothetical protein BGZ90_001120 [Linnemannia elongata]
MEKTRKLLKEVLGVDELTDAVGYNDGERGAGTRYYIPSDTPEALTFRKLLTTHEQEAFAKENCSYALTYDIDKNLTSVQKGPMWDKNQHAKPIKTATN